MDHSTFHTCGNLPVQAASVTVYYCAHHDAWTIWADAHISDAEGPVRLWGESVELGPFDGAQAAHEQAASAIVTAVQLLGQHLV